MPSFQPMFTKSKGQPIEFQGKSLVMADYFPTNGATKFQLVIEGSNATWRQGVVLRLLYKGGDGKWQKGAAVGDEGRFVINGDESSGKNGVVIWHSPSRKTTDFDVVGNASVICVHNAWDCGNGVVESWHNGAAMIVEELPNGRRYRCNDGEADEDFDDLIFRVERVS